ncbi:hypothetical protein ACQJ8J_03725 [Helicobacter pylori]
MPLPFILAGVAIAAAGYGVKKGIDALDADCEADEFIKKAESLKIIIRLLNHTVYVILHVLGMVVFFIVPQTPHQPSLL